MPKKAKSKRPATAKTVKLMTPMTPKRVAGHQPHRAPDPVRDRLEVVALIRESPAEDAPRLVYADWLLQRGDSRGELIHLQCRLAADPSNSELRGRERELLANLPRPTWAAEWPPHYERGFATCVAVRDLAALRASCAEIIADHPLARLELANGSSVVARPDGAWFAQLDRREDSVGTHGVGGCHTTSTVARIFDSAGRIFHELAREYSVSSWESSGDSEEGMTIDAIRFAADGEAVIISMSSGGDVVVPLSSTSRPTSMRTGVEGRDARRDMTLALEGIDDVVIVDGESRIRVGTASLNSFGYGGSMDLDTWGEAELFCRGEEIVVVLASAFWDPESFVCHWVRWRSDDHGRSWRTVLEAQELEDTPSLSFVTNSPSGTRNEMVAGDRIERIWATLRETAPFLPKEHIRGWAVLLLGGVGAKPPGRNADLKRAKKKIDQLPEQKRSIVIRKLRKVVELDEIE
jgi:uncharacterized protein (TIGR02996 family)